ncbi:MAG: hypothetical protein AAFU85_15205 [Planctomycetota bacterium]
MKKPLNWSMKDILLLVAVVAFVFANCRYYFLGRNEKLKFRRHALATREALPSDAYGLQIYRIPVAGELEQRFRVRSPSPLQIELKFPAADGSVSVERVALPERDGIYSLYVGGGELRVCHCRSDSVEVLFSAEQLPLPATVSPKIRSGVHGELPLDLVTSTSRLTPFRIRLLSR